MEERTPWWKAFLKRKPNPDFDPFASRPEKPKDSSAASKTPGEKSQSQSQTQVGQAESHSSTGLSNDETYDDSQLESVFNEQTCRRNMRVSRSGRFKEKRRVRSSLPVETKETDKKTSG